MEASNKLRVGDKSENGQIEIVDEDRLCYLVKSMSKGALGLRTISKKLLDEYITYWRENPESTPNIARTTLSGGSMIDRFEYGYSSTLSIMAQMVLSSNPQPSCPEEAKPEERNKV